MLENKEAVKDLLKDLVVIMHKLKVLESRPQEFDGVKLYAAEVHTMQGISRFKDISAKELSQRLCVTKGAVSQMLSKLEAKGYIKKAKDKMNQNWLRLTLTEKGQGIVKSHQQKYMLLYEKIVKYVGDFTDEDYKKFKFVLSSVSGDLDQYLEKEDIDIYKKL